MKVHDRFIKIYNIGDIFSNLPFKIFYRFGGTYWFDRHEESDLSWEMASSLKINLCYCLPSDIISSKLSVSIVPDKSDDWEQTKFGQKCRVGNLGKLKIGQEHTWTLPYA